MEFLGVDIPDREEVKKASKERTLSPFELLVLKSRSFVFPVVQLRGLRSQGEADKSIVIQDLYNVLRQLDTAEDGTLPVEEKKDAINNFLYVLNEVARKRQGDGIEDVINGKEMRKVTEKISEGAVDEEERIFVEHFGRGGVLREIIGFDDMTRRAIANHTATMASGMMKYLGEPALGTIEELKNYCFYVAGNVGDALTEIVEIADGNRLNKEEARTLGELLQITNIMKNAKEDITLRRVSYVPKELYVGFKSDRLIDGTGKKVREVRDSARRKIYDVVVQNLPKAVGYISSAPQKLSGYKAFCLTPLIAAMETWNVMMSLDSDRVFNGEEEAVKIGRATMGNILGFTSRLVKRSDANLWLEKYKQDYSKYPFNEENYASWSGEWTK